MAGQCEVKPVRLLAFAALLLPGLTGCSDHCTAVLCRETFVLNLVPAGSQFSAGLYEVTIDIGYLRTCTFTVESNGVSPAECDMDSASVSSGQFSMKLLGTPDQVTVTVVRDGALLLDETQPVEQPETDGSGCHGSCATVTQWVTLP
jgi:hypothetical protein